MTQAAFILDTGALIAFEKNKRAFVVLLDEARLAGIAIRVPTVVIAEAWRGGRRSARIARLLSTCHVDPLLEPVARMAGEALASVRSATVIDAIVVASGVARGAHVVTSDPDDLRPLVARLGGMPVIAI
jgi:predicted nucleic acid-binding protein